ncbi:MAG: hypothetical protein QXW70_00280 [Candidatus Anstonellales archaeon]
MDEKKKDLAFILLTSAILLLLIYTTGAGGFNQAGIALIALAFCGVVSGYIMFDIFRKNLTAKQSGLVMAASSILAIVASSILILGKLSFSSLGFIFILFFLLPPISVISRTRLVES